MAADSGPRIVSLLPSATEIVCALGFKHKLVGRSHECDYPSDIRDLPVCTAPRFDTSGSSAEVDARVKEILRDALSIYEVDAAMLAALNPDVIVTQSQCEVCAVSIDDVEKALADWTGGAPKVVSLEPNGLGDVWRDILNVATVLAVPGQGTDLVNSLQARMKKISDRARALETHPAVACVEWIDPLMAAGNWVPELVAMAGGQNLFGQAGIHSPWLQWQDLVAADPEVILVMPCGYDIAKTQVELDVLRNRSEWPGLRAVRSERVIVTDGNQYFNRPGPRLAESLEIMAETLHPEAFSFGHKENGWVRLSL